MSDSSTWSNTALEMEILEQVVRAIDYQRTPREEEGVSGRAVCWEISASPAPRTDTEWYREWYRYAIAGPFLLTQKSTVESKRARWKVYKKETLDEAIELATQWTAQLEESGFNVKVTIQPATIILHLAELEFLSKHRAVPPSLRARIYTSCERRLKPWGSVRGWEE